MPDRGEQANTTGVRGDYRLIARLAVAIVAGLALGHFIRGAAYGTALHQVIGSIQHFCGQIIFFLVPLVVLAFIGPAIVRLGANASRMLAAALVLAYASSIGAAFLAYGAGTRLFPHLVVAATAVPDEVADIIFKFDIPPLMTVMTAMTTAFLFGLGILWSGTETLRKLWDEFEECVRRLVRAVVVPLLPLFVAATFARLAYSGTSIRHLPLFAAVVAVALAGHFVWIALLYGIAGLVSGKNPWLVARHYGPAYLTAAGTMSSAATIPVSLACARKSPVLSREIVDFMIPLCATIHLCGSVLTETLCVLVISRMLYGAFPPFESMLLFILLLGLFAVGAPGVPTGTAMGTLGLVSGVLGFDAAGVALFIAAFTLQDSFGTACNVTADGALALIMEGVYGKRAGVTGTTKVASSRSDNSP